jgi:hypothetical protein
LDDTALCEQYGKQAREYVVQKWAWDMAVKRLEDYLREAAISKKGRASHGN